MADGERKSWTPRLDSKTSIAVALGTAAVVFGVFQHYLPSVVDHRVGAPQDKDASAAERAATFTSTALVGALFLVTMDPLVFIIGGGTVAALSWTHRHANMVSPLTSKATVAASMSATAAIGGGSDDDTAAAYDDSMAGAY